LQIFSDQLAEEFYKAEVDIGQSCSETDIFVPFTPITYKTFHGFQNASGSVRHRFYPPKVLSGNTTPSMSFVNESGETKVQPFSAGGNVTPSRSRFKFHNPFVSLKHPSKNPLANKRREKNSQGKVTRFAVEKVEDSEKKTRFEVEKVADQTQGDIVTQSVLSSNEASNPLLQETTEL